MLWILYKDMRNLYYLARNYPEKFRLWGDRFALVLSDGVSYVVHRSYVNLVKNDHVVRSWDYVGDIHKCLRTSDIMYYRHEKDIQEASSLLKAETKK